jgi:CcmD family protein
MFLLQQSPPNTTSYMVAGYAVIFIVLLIYLFSLAMRRKNLKQDLSVLQDMEDKSE